MQAAASLATSAAISQSQTSSNSYNGMPVSNSKIISYRIITFVMMIKKKLISSDGFCTFDINDR
jgi:hypothetical protein